MGILVGKNLEGSRSLLVYEVSGSRGSQYSVERERERGRDNIYITVLVLTLLLSRENIIWCLSVLGVFIFLSGITQ